MSANIIMGGKSKLQKARESALKDLRLIKGKLHARTYNAYEEKIYDKGIAGIGKIVSEINVLKNKPLLKLTQPLIKNVLQVETFNTSNKTTTFRNLTPEIIKNIVRSVDLSGDKRTILNVGNRHYTLNPQYIQQLIRNIDEFWVEGLDGQGSDAEALIAIKQVNEVSLSRPVKKVKSAKEGAFFKYYHKTKLDLEKFGIYTEKQKSYDENCLLQALLAYDIDPTILSAIRHIVKGIHIKTADLKQIADDYNLHITVKTISPEGTNSKNASNLAQYGENRKKKVEEQTGIRINLGLIDKHFFAIKPVDITSWALKNYFELCDKKDFHKITNSEGKKKEDRFIDSYDVIKYMFENKERYLTEMPTEDILDTQYYKECGEIEELDYVETAVKENTVKVNKVRDTKIIFFDFETTTEGVNHQPYLVCNSETETCYGEECGYDMLLSLYNKFHKNYKTLTLIAHNCGYDFRFIQQYLTLRTAIERGHNILQVEAVFFASAGKKINIILKDSYAIIAMPLSGFGKCFGLTITKDIIPYSLYTVKNVAKQLIKLEDIKPYCDYQVKCNILDRLIT